jgi:hypothetical protein
MTTEWLALWIHFVWSGGLTMAFCLALYWKIGAVTSAMSTKNNDPHKNARNQESTKQKRRLLHIAEMISACLLLNIVATLWTSSKLEEWGRTADLSLTCHIKEGPFSRNWEAYGFGEQNGVEVCSTDDALKVSAAKCRTGCYWYPAITLDTLHCQTVNDDLSLEELVDLNAKSISEGAEPRFNPCDCDCHHFVEVETPRYATG